MDKKSPKRSLDELLIEQGFFATLKEAHAHIMAGDVIVDDKRIDKPKVKFPETASIRVRGQEHPYVSRGGLKLEGALKTWPIAVNDAVCIDVGASTGGFTDVLLQHGARMVYAVDVGYGQLAEKLRTDPRVVNMERTHINKIERKDLEPRPSIAVIDVSFISLKKVLPHVVELIENQAYVVALIKPQFEAKSEDIAIGGIVISEQVRQNVVEECKCLAEQLGFNILGVCESPIKGAKGNVEYLMVLQRSV